MKDKTIDVLMGVAGMKPCKVNIIGSHKNLKYLVNPTLYLMADVEAIIIEEDVALICNSEGYLLGLKGNRKLDKTIIAGTFFIVGIKNGVISSLTKENQEKYYKRFEKIETHSDKDVSDSYWDSAIDRLKNSF